MNRKKIMKLASMLLCFAMFCGVFAGTTFASAADEVKSEMKVGVGIGDITGPITQISTGYNSVGDVMNGILMKLYARAFVAESEGKRICYVSAEIVHMTESIKPGVLKELKKRGINDYNEQNLMLAATHCHSSASNTSWYSLYDLVNGVSGFDDVYYNVVVKGIADAIQNATKNLQVGSIELNSGDIDGAVANRSLDAYKTNKGVDADGATVYNSLNTEMVLLRFNNAQGTGIGAFNWFGSHGTSNSIDNTLISADHKGYAAYEMEKQKGNGFVAAFSQSESGDASPNTPPDEDYHADFLRPVQLGQVSNVIENEIFHGSKELAAANDLYAKASETLEGTVDYRYNNVNFSNIKVERNYIGDYYMPYDDVDNASTSTPCIGAGILAGDEEGAPVDGAVEGQIKHEYTDNGDGTYTQQPFDFNTLDLYGLQHLMGPLWPTAMKILQSDDYDEAQAEKVVCLNVGNLMQTIQPLQIFRIGQLAIVGVPFEITTVQAQRMRNVLYETLASSGVTKIVLSTLTNSYSQYVTTREEYAAQHYEGSTCLFGPWSGAALTQELDKLAQSLKGNDSYTSGSSAPDMSGRMIKTPAASIGLVKDDGQFGKIISGTKASYAKGETASVTFQGANPRNIAALKADGKLGNYFDGEYHYMEIQKAVGKGNDQGYTWETVCTDSDPYTTFTWKRTAGYTSQSTLTWVLDDPELMPGTYRFKYNGLSRNVLGRFSKFICVSRSFDVTK